MQRGDRRQGVREVVDDDHEVRLQERGQWRSDRIRVGQRDRGLEGRDGVVREDADGAAGEARQVGQRSDAAPGHEAAQRLREGRRRGRSRATSSPACSTPTGRERVVAPPSRTSSMRRGSVPRNEYRPRRSPPSTDSRRYAGVPSSSARKTPIGVSRSASRVARSRTVSYSAARRLASAREIGSSMSVGNVVSRNRNDPSSPGTKGRAFRGATLFRLCRTHLYRRGRLPADRRCPVSLALCAGAYLVASLGHLWVRRLTGAIHSRRHPGSHQVPGLCAGGASVTRPDHRPIFDWAAVWTCYSSASRAGAALFDRRRKRATLRGLMQFANWYYV